MCSSASIEMLTEFVATPCHTICTTNPIKTNARRNRYHEWNREKKAKSRTRSGEKKSHTRRTLLVISACCSCISNHWNQNNSNVVLVDSAQYTWKTFSSLPERSKIIHRIVRSTQIPTQFHTNAFHSSLASFHSLTASQLRCFFFPVRLMAY